LNNLCFLGPLMTQRWYVSGHMLFLYWDTFSSVMKWKMSWRKSWLLSVTSSSTCKYYHWWSTDLRMSTIFLPHLFFPSIT
jgi:hypothetical protein